MANKTLREQIAERKKEMEDKDVNGKTAYIATLLGHKTSRHTPTSGCEETWFIFENKRFRIEDYGISCTDAGSFHREVKYNGRRVFYMAGGGEESFIPGEWEKEFNRLYAKAQSREKELKKAKDQLRAWRQEEEDIIERKKWGL